MAKAANTNESRVRKRQRSAGGPLVAIVVDSSLPYDREIAKGVGQYAREVGDWRLYIEEEACRRLPDLDESTHWSPLQRELTAWLRELPKPVGIMACDDLRARHVLEACRSLGLRVPHDVAVIGVDHVRLAEARRLVTTTDLPLKAVAPRMGLSSVAYMTTLFRRHFGTTPAALRAASRGRASSVSSR